MIGSAKPIGCCELCGGQKFSVGEMHTGMCEAFRELRARAEKLASDFESHVESERARARAAGLISDEGAG